MLGRGAQVGAAATLGASFLAACGSSSSPSSGATSAGGSTSAGATPSMPPALSALPGGTPKRGGTFTVGTISNGSAESLFPGAAYVNSDWARQYALFEPLFYIGKDLQPLVPALATSAEPNSDATVWTLHLRDGVHWHDGKPFTADDVVWNFHVWAVPTNTAYGNTIANLIDPSKVKALDKLTVQVPLMQPMAEFPTILGFFGCLLVQNGATEKSVQAKPVGTGPFVYESFTAGQRSVFKANTNYWQSGQPYVDELIVDSSYTDETARFNALLANTINLLPGVPLATARAQATSKQVQILAGSPIGQYFSFCMRVDKGPFVDNRVRLGFKLLTGRQEMIDAALSGYGVPMSDMTGYGCKYYPTDIVRHQDVEQAKSMFKAAGVLGKTFTLQTAEAFAGQVEAATVLAAQAPAAGVSVRVQTLSPSTYFAPAGGFLVRPFGQEINESNASLTANYRVELVKNAPYPDTRWISGPYANQRNAVVLAAMAELNPTKAAEKWRVASEQQFNEGGYLWWAAFPFVDAAANNIHGLSAGAGFNYNDWQWKDGWIA
jgi:peptide/nickel transport system substrate-binding protein